MGSPTEVGMAFVLSCTLAERIAAIAVVAQAQTLPSNWCTPDRPVPLIAFHGDADPIVPYEGGPLGDPFNPVKPVFAAIREFVSAAAERNHCAKNCVRSAVAIDVTRLAFTDCTGDAAVVFYTVLGGGHTWPGGKPMPEWRVGRTSGGIAATSAMWAFYLGHPLRGPQNGD
jgi:polyhydroxybutyrate depolymerase